jgi:FkbM family methyltransferase
MKKIIFSVFLIGKIYASEDAALNAEASSTFSSVQMPDATKLSALNFNPNEKSECILFKKAEYFFGIKSTGVIHIGASIAEELAFYDSRDVGKVLYVEANPAVFEQLNLRIAEMQPKSQVSTFNFAACSTCKTLEFHVTSNLKSSSLFELANHKTEYPYITEVGVITVDGKRAEDVFTAADLAGINTMVLDIQGGEMDALRGCASFLNQIDFIVSEVNFSELYKGIPRVEELDAELLKYSFRRLETMCNGKSWGDALYINIRLLESHT